MNEGEKMPKSEMLHKFYQTCQDIELGESFDLISDAETEEEADFIRVVTDFVLQQKQEKAVSEKRF